MFLGAGVELGVSQESLAQALSGLKVPGWKLSVSRAVRHAIRGTHLDVVLDESLAMFRALGEAEAKVRKVEVEDVRRARVVSTTQRHDFVSSPPGGDVRRGMNRAHRASADATGAW